MDRRLLRSGSASILVVPILPHFRSEVLVGESGTIDLHPAGKPGYNVAFTTAKNFTTVIHTYQRFFTPDAVAHIPPHENPLSFSKLMDSLESFSEEKEFFTHITQDTLRMPDFWYTNLYTEEFFNGERVFAFNTPCYDTELFSCAYSLSNYPLTPKDKEFFESLVLNPIQ